MHKFPQLTAEDYAQVYLEDTDKDLPKSLNPNFRYAYFKTIARGGKALIQSCKDMYMGRHICYKSLLPDFADDPVEQKRLLREARISAMLQHPATVPTYELGRDRKGHYYFTMKLVHGYTLREIFDYRERYDLSQLVDVVVQVAYALEYAHSHGVVHRDIKPENILVGPYGEVLLLDWGLAKVWNKKGGNSLEDLGDPQQGSEDQSMTGYQKLQGTISYMSPEQINKDPSIDERTDIYSLGAIMYEMLVGEPPAKGETIVQLISSTLNDEPHKPSEVAKTSVPPLLEKATMECLVKKADGRIQSASQLIRLLQQSWSIV